MNKVGSESVVLHCDVVIGSALIYSPHHACVADVLLRAFSEGGCQIAYVMQLSTRQAMCYCAVRRDEHKESMLTICSWGGRLRVKTDRYIGID